jgi:thiosulfate dehydrogenase
MKRIWFVITLAATIASTSFIANAVWAADPGVVDLTQAAQPDFATIGNDPFGQLVKYGYALFTDTANQIGPTVPDPAKRLAGNNLTCESCHLRGGTQAYAMPLVGVWGQFPQYRAREGAVVTLEDRINGCMERSLNGHPLLLESREMMAFIAYMRWLSDGIPVGVKLRGAGTLRINDPERAADPARGAKVYGQICAACHGLDGLGQRAKAGAGYRFPPLWGLDSFNDGAGMSRLLTMAAYASHNMPLGTTFNAPVLTDEDAYDVGAYILSMKRPVKADLDKDYPVRLQKPVDAPYSPYADGFSLKQHTYGPFAPIRAKVRELAAQSGVQRPGTPDNGSDETELRGPKKLPP